ncbi:tRNA (guanine-N(7)-)-methyltransferase [Pontibacter ummariensis]|uniref:tRNA (guanine-N(7)-)-methyltransferase n=1 Tax=Pontibacter ummariensis TaxID=1610492 RepID=A0A239BZD3_9BACT|nr:tRNA (guanosine(46)-N7)-methyltransferase TrmB [Pontibacter ummariensis]PRY15554.1 tRNA (guanine-N(7)-)-methyltransferase [Pontibacter ummariensis]SNS12791.1 tRNA (guanine-N(7)-)-methyltransferase [Pontibacter ummariensis]
MGRSKLAKFAAIGESENVIEPGDERYGLMKGQWRTSYFGNQHPLVLEVGCGRGEYTVGMARLFPEKNFIGSDIKGARLWKGSTMAEEEELQNVAFLRSFIEKLDENFAEEEVDEIWITFPDPRPRDRDIKRRLTSPRFLELYKQILKADGVVHLKTDNTGLYQYTLEVLAELKDQIKNLKYTADLYNSDLQEHTMGIYTTYEKRYLAEGVSIKYLQFQFQFK